MTLFKNNPEPVYIGIFLHPAESKKLLKYATLGDTDPSKCAHHITVMSPATPNKKEAYLQYEKFLGEPFTLYIKEVIRGSAIDKKGNVLGQIEAAIIKTIEPEVPYLNPAYKHITLSRDSSNIPPVYAGKIDLYNCKIEKIELQLKGRLGFFYGSGDNGRVVYSKEMYVSS